MSTELFDVVIAGYGPVGATLANLLVQQGVRVAVVEREASVYHLARAGHFDAEIMRVFQNIGIAEAVEATTDVTRAMRFVDADGALLMEWKRGGDKGPLGWVSDYMFFQPALERALRDQLVKSALATVFLRHDVFAVEEQPDRVVLRAEDMATGRLTRIAGRYVVGCDGARSLVRRLIGSEHEDLGFKQRWLVVDVRQKRDLGLEKVSIQHCNPARPMYASCLALGVLRWEIMLHDDDDPAEVTTDAAIWDFIEGSVRPVRREDGMITRSAIYTFESLLAHRWRQGRMLLAGDSAHRTPPFLGQGMCAGIRDAANLAWKLAAVCQGRSGDALLDTYQAERHPHVRAFIVGAVEAGRLIQMSDAAQHERVRDMRANPQRYAPPNPPLGPGLSPHYGTDGMGRPLPQPEVNGRLLDEWLGTGFAVVCTPAGVDAQSAARLEQRFARVKLVVLPPGHEALLQPYGAAAVLVRPDRYVHATAPSVAALLEHIAALPIDLA